MRGICYSGPFLLRLLEKRRALNLPLLNPGDLKSAPPEAKKEYEDYVEAVCREIGSNGLGASCKAQFDCEADMNCQGNSGFKCKAMCDDAHACDGGTCTRSAGLPNDGGVCQ